MLFRSENSFWRSPLISKFRTNLSLSLFFFRKRESNRTLDTISHRRSKIEKKHSIRGGGEGKWIGEQPCKKLRKMVAAHGRPWISFYRPLPVPSTLQRSSERPFFAHPLRKYAAALKPRFWFRRKKKKKNYRRWISHSLSRNTTIEKEKEM